MSAAVANTEQAIKAGRLLPGMNFDQRVWAITSRIPRGKVATYAQVAKALRSTGYRAVGMALNRNPFAPEVPCHRVVGSTGKLVGYAGGLSKKKAMLAEEGVLLNGDRVDLVRCACSL
jgi:methylated-DNA-[protein]-cysteine S-methyltransferase